MESKVETFKDAAAIIREYENYSNKEDKHYLQQGKVLKRLKKEDNFI